MSEQMSFQDAENKLRTGRRAIPFFYSPSACPGIWWPDVSTGFRKRLCDARTDTLLACSDRLVFDCRVFVDRNCAPSSLRMESHSRLEGARIRTSSRIWTNNPNTGKISMFKRVWFWLHIRNFHSRYGGPRNFQGSESMTRSGLKSNALTNVKVNHLLLLLLLLLLVLLFNSVLPTDQT